jgi:hypothetical protein
MRIGKRKKSKKEIKTHTIMPLILLTSHHVSHDQEASVIISMNVLIY